MQRYELTELTADDPEVRASYLKHFGPQVEEFADAMAVAFVNLLSLSPIVGKDLKRTYVFLLAHLAITLHIQSLKVFLLGLQVAAGNLFRQALESIALALLCSGKDNDVLDRFMADAYLTSNAIRDAIVQSDSLGVDKTAVEELKTSQRFYHNYSHPTQLTLAAGFQFSKEGVTGALYVGAAFDDRKVHAYAKEVETRLNLALVFSSFVDAVKANLTKW
jgi:hypothetical protein